MRTLQEICRLKLRPALFMVGLVVLILPTSSSAQNTVSQTLNVTVVPLGGLFMQASPLALTKTGTNFNSFMGTITLSYRARTRQGTGQGIITVKANSDFAPIGGPSIANPPSAADKFTYTCSGATLGVSCSGIQTVSTTTSTNVVSLGASACTGGGAPCSTANPNSANVTFILPDDPKYKTGSYSATLTWTISAS
jgi:hypothetical protein